MFCKCLNEKHRLILVRVFMLFALCILLGFYFLIGSVGYGFQPSWVWFIAFFALISLFVYLISALPKFGTSNRILIVTLTLIFLLYVLFTGGLFLEFNEKYSFSSIHGIFDDMFGHDEVVTSIYVDTDGHFVIPLIGYIYYPKNPPYAIQLYIYDKTQTLNSICIETIHINYGNSTKKYELNWNRNISSGNDAYVGSISDIIELNKSCDIQLSGYFTDFNGNTKSFETLNRLDGDVGLDYPERGWRIYSLWSGFHD